MTLSLQKFKAYGAHCEGDTRQQAQQVVEMFIVGANTDVTWDISADTNGALGTFWTAAIANATYGSLARTALAFLQKLQGYALDLKPPEAEALSGYSSVSTAATSVLSFLSAAIAGGSATPTATVTGLLATDTLLATTQKVQNDNQRVPIEYGAPANNALPITYAVDPGGNGKVLVAVTRTAGSVAPAAGQFVYTVTNHLPKYVFAATNAPTSAYLRLNWTLPDNTEAVTADLGANF